MKRFLLRAALFIIQKYSVQSLEISLEKAFYFGGNYYQITAISETLTYNGTSRLSFGADKVVPLSIQKEQGL